MFYFFVYHIKDWIMGNTASNIISSISGQNSNKTANSGNGSVNINDMTYFEGAPCYDLFLHGSSMSGFTSKHVSGTITASGTLPSNDPRAVCYLQNPHANNSATSTPKATNTTATGMIPVASTNGPAKTEPFVGTISQYQLVKRPDWMPPYYDKSGLYVIMGDTNPEAPFINPTVIYPSCVYNAEGHMICRTCDNCPLKN
jgi:hypothetical protein